MEKVSDWLSEFRNDPANAALLKGEPFWMKAKAKAAADAAAGVSPKWKSIPEIELEFSGPRLWKKWMQDQKENRKIFRSGMLERDHYAALPHQWIAHPVELWSMKEVKNRLKWLKEQRGTLLGKPDKVHELATNTRKIRKYTRELFRRGTAEYLKQERDGRNARRRQRRVEAKKRAKKALVDRWFQARKERRLAKAPQSHK